mgnify:CR=1 FL=1
MGSALSQTATDRLFVYAALLQVPIESSFVTDAARIHQGAASTSTFDRILPLHTCKRNRLLVQTKRGGHPQQTDGSSVYCPLIVVLGQCSVSQSREED